MTSDVTIPAAPILASSPAYTILLQLDLDAARTFYRDVLGLRVLREDIGEHDARIVIEAGEGTRLILSRSTVGTADRQTQAAFRVPDIRAAIAELRSRNVRIEEYTSPDPVTHDGVADMGHSWAAWFIDPSRNCLAIVQAKADPDEPRP